ncbi:uncharacterized protein PV07_08633 [Cladophialophora immunda]|uniref:Uncharacterized protein n=1 Tax=Cladophialophora immunda TaxID=569365 RepID=A0A0D1ZCL1_9EURO|nr:uncharacterized protein PV07_08633 [Cladophialophora immunda]KIW25466.1 hypothetical protein PV07_08633 [Cladophialophora immunda]
MLCPAWQKRWTHPEWVGHRMVTRLCKRGTSMNNQSAKPTRSRLDGRSLEGSTCLDSSHKARASKTRPVTAWLSFQMRHSGGKAGQASQRSLPHMHLPSYPCPCRSAPSTIPVYPWKEHHGSTKNIHRGRTTTNSRGESSGTSLHRCKDADNYLLFLLAILSRQR